MRYRSNVAREASSVDSVVPRKCQQIFNNPTEDASRLVLWFVLFFSSSSRSLSCCRRSLAHFANSSWLLVAVNSRRTAKYSACFVRCSENCFDIAIGREVAMRQTWKNHVSIYRLATCPEALVGGAQRHTNVLIVVAPMLLMSWITSSTMNMRTSKEGILAAGEDVHCDVLCEVVGLVDGGERIQSNGSDDGTASVPLGTRWVGGGLGLAMGLTTSVGCSWSFLRQQAATTSTI